MRALGGELAKRKQYPPDMQCGNYLKPNRIEVRSKDRVFVVFQPIKSTMVGAEQIDSDRLKDKDRERLPNAEVHGQLFAPISILGAGIRVYTNRSKDISPPDLLSLYPTSATDREREGTVDGDHGRIETRTCWCSGELADIDGASAWKGIRSIVLVESKRQANGHTSTEQRYYISSLAPRAKRCLEVSRTHWSIENNLHWVLDVAFREDEARTRKGSGAQIHSALNKIVINLCKQNKRKMSINRKRNMASWDMAFLDELLLGTC